MNGLEYPGYISLSVTFICTTVQLCILFDLIRHTKNKLSTKAKTSIILAYGSIVSFSLYSIGIFIQSIYEISVSSSQFDRRICTYRYITPFFFQIGKILMFWFFIARLYGIFFKSTLKYKILPLKLFGIFCLIIFSLPSVLFGIVTLDGLIHTNPNEINTVADCNGVTDNSSFGKPLRITAIAMNMIGDLIASIIMLRLYLKRLILLSNAFDKFEFKSEHHKQKNECFMTLILKTTNLMIISILTEYIVLIVSAASIGIYWMSINHTINVLCIYLSFGGFNDKLYDDLCCCVDKYCYGCCSSLCILCCMPCHTDERVAVAIAETSRSVKQTASVTDVQVQPPTTINIVNI
eukprot:67203_1